MPSTSAAENEPGKDQLSEDLREKRKIILRELRERSFWYVRVRWWVPFSILAGVGVGWFLGFRFAVLPLVCIAAYVFVYNTVLCLVSRKVADPYDNPVPIQHFTYWQVGLDYSCMFLLIHFTGGTVSPVLFFFLFHIIFASMLLPLRSAYWFASLAALGTGVIVGLNYFGVLSSHGISYGNNQFEPGEGFVVVAFLFFTAALYITAYSTTQVMGMLRHRILDLAEANEAIEEFNTERSQFVMRVAHDLRAPLVAMCSMLDIVRGGYKGDLNAGQQDQLDRIDNRAHGMIDMIGELMSLAKSKRGKPELNFVTLDLKAVSDHVCPQFTDEAARKGLSLTIDVPEGLPPIRGDVEMVEQLFENLVSNAIKYTPSGGRVELHCSCERGETVRIVVSDTGIGIPEADMSQLFSEFFRSKNAREMEKLGTGLGLAITKSIVENHDGRIKAESEVNKGTVFTVEFPALKK